MTEEQINKSTYELNNKGKTFFLVLKKLKNSKGEDIAETSARYALIKYRGDRKEPVIDLKYLKRDLDYDKKRL